MERTQMVTGVAGALGVVERREAGRLLENLTAPLRAWTGSVSRPTPARMLDLWRDAERDLAAAPLGTMAWDEAHARCETARYA